MNMNELPKEVYRLRSKEWYSNNRERALEIKRNSLSKKIKEDPDYVRRTNLKNDFGITLEQYNEMLEIQNGVCALCGLEETSKQRGKIVNLSVDHCHTSGKIRALLCRNCNTGLGNFNDDISKLEKAIKYLEEHKND